MTFTCQECGSELLDECEKCPHRITKTTILGTNFYFCRCECGRPENSGHPLSPCMVWGCDEDEYAECQTEQYAILEGHRCAAYGYWLYRMHRLREGLPIEEVL